MKVLSPRAHALLDFVSWWVFLLAPRRFHGETPAVADLACYLFALGGFAVCMCTRYPLGVLPLISFQTHGKIERLCVPVLILLPWLGGFSDVPGARAFFVMMGLALALLCWATDYDAAG